MYIFIHTPTNYPFVICTYKVMIVEIILHVHNYTISLFTYVHVHVHVHIRTNVIIFPYMQLFRELCPNTTANFVSLCSGDHGFSEDETRLSYLNSIFHRIVPSGWIQGGGRCSTINKGVSCNYNSSIDICGGSGLSGMSIYGRTFPGNLENIK